MSSGNSNKGALPSYERNDPRQAIFGARAGDADC